MTPAVAVSDPATAYAEAVAAGDAIAGPYVRAACDRHLRDLETGEDRGLVWDPEDADRVTSFFPTVLRLAGGEHEGKPFHLEPWEAFIVGSLFGWKKANGCRRFTVAFVETGKGSGKSPLAAGIGMYMMASDGESRAEVYAAAMKKDQAKVLFRDAVAMVEQSPALSRRIKISGAKGAEHNLLYGATNSFFRPISTENRGRGQSGPRPHCALLDEVHEHPTNAMVEFMRAGVKGRRQPLVFMITNSGVDRHSVCYDYHDYGTKVAAGDVEDDSFFAYICAVDEGDDPLTDEPDEGLGYPASWAKTNPSIGVTFPVSYLAEQVLQAKGVPSKESVVRRLNFCQWVDAASPWIDGDLWRACEVEDLDLPPDGDLYLALDLSGKLDLTAMAAVCPTGDEYVAMVRFWTPADTLGERERKDRVPYRRWVEGGHMEASPGRSIDYAVPAAAVAKLYGTGRVVALAFDPYRMDDFARELDKLGVPYRYWEGVERPTASDGLLLVRHGQGFGGGASDRSVWMPRSIDVLENAVLGEALKVRKNPALTWGSASAVLQTDAQGNQKWEKRKSTGRIDGIVALSMALGAADALSSVPEQTGGWLA